MSATIELSEVDKRFANGVEAVRELSVQIAPGQFVSLLGPSGCGKSTVLRLIAGLERPSAGTVRINAAPAEQRVEVMSYVFQEATLMPWSSVLDNVALPLRVKGTAARVARDSARRALTAVGLRDRANAYPAELSGGMKMRASIARALVTRPAVLLLDEPFAALDEITRQRLNDELLALWGEQAPTAVFVTHSVFEAVYLSQRVLVMGGQPGRLIADLPVELAYPRAPALRLQPQFTRHCRNVTEALEHAQRTAEAMQP
ncbi:MAG TPA: ABC transporter ATP-binding protein [Burkholderiaceae bacterium]|nr:ABC transporter ATP-binding protein [Burkholderiaceae bacterium]